MELQPLLSSPIISQIIPFICTSIGVVIGFFVKGAQEKRTKKTRVHEESLELASSNIEMLITTTGIISRIKNKIAINDDNNENVSAISQIMEDIDTKTTIAFDESNLLYAKLHVKGESMGLKELESINRGLKHIARTCSMQSRLVSQWQDEMLNQLNTRYKLLAEKQSLEKERDELLGQLERRLCEGRNYPRQLEDEVIHTQGKTKDQNE